MARVTRHTRQITIIDDQVRGIIKIRDERVTTHTVLPDRPKDDDNGDPSPPGARIASVSPFGQLIRFAASGRIEVDN